MTGKHKFQKILFPMIYSELAYHFDFFSQGMAINAMFIAKNINDEATELDFIAEHDLARFNI